MTSYSQQESRAAIIIKKVDKIDKLTLTVVTVVALNLAIFAVSELKVFVIKTFKIMAYVRMPLIKYCFISDCKNNSKTCPGKQLLFVKYVVTIDKFKK